MKKHILERYRRDTSGKLVIDIAAAKVSDLYEDFDLQAPYIKKDLDYDLVEYLIESVREIHKEPFSVHLSFTEHLTADLEKRVRKSIHNYFDYLLATNRREVLKALRSSFILLSIGLSMLAISIYLNLKFDLDDAVVEGVMAEGLVIAAWVSVWEGLAAVLLNGPPLWRDRKVYQKLADTTLVFCSE